MLKEVLVICRPQGDERKVHRVMYNVLDKRDNESIIEDINHWRYILGNLRTRPRDDYQTSGSVHVICWPFPMFRTSDDG